MIKYADLLTKRERFGLDTVDKTPSEREQSPQPSVAVSIGGLILGPRGHRTPLYRTVVVNLVPKVISDGSGSHGVY